MPDTPRFLVTAGNTREMIDRVRDWGNVFTGNTGLAIARALARVGDVDLLTSNQAHLEDLVRDPGRIRGSGFRSYTQLAQALNQLMTSQLYDGVFVTAAVADYTPAGVYEVLERREADGGGEIWQVRSVQAEKVKSTYGQIAIRGQPTAKIVDRFRSEWGHRGLLVKFKLEVGIAADELIHVAQASRRSSAADYLVANTLDMVEGDKAGAYLLGEQGQEWVPRAQLAERLARLAEQWVEAHPS
jgi:phosphopantothenoylcysteine synthetase/decarboxylase